MISIPAYIGLGSNLDRPVDQVLSALQKLSQIPGIKLMAVSSLYQSAPVGLTDQDDFINAVAQIKTVLEPLALLGQLQSIEQNHQRQRLIRWGPRTLDLDLLLYDQLILRTERLTLPHPQILQRRFVIEPLLEINPQIRLPDSNCPLSQVLQQLSNQELRKIMTASAVRQACS